MLNVNKQNVTQMHFSVAEAMHVSYKLQQYSSMTKKERKRCK